MTPTFNSFLGMLNETRKSPTNVQQAFTFSHLSFSFIQIRPMDYLEGISHAFLSETNMLRKNNKAIILHRCLFGAINSAWDQSPYFTNYDSDDLLGGHSLIFSSCWYRHHYIPWHFCLDFTKFLQSQCDFYMIFTIFVFFFLVPCYNWPKAAENCAVPTSPGTVDQVPTRPFQTTGPYEKRGGPRWAPKHQS